MGGSPSLSLLALFPFPPLSLSLSHRLWTNVCVYMNPRDMRGNRTTENTPTEVCGAVSEYNEGPPVESTSSCFPPFCPSFLSSHPSSPPSLRGPVGRRPPRGTPARQHVLTRAGNVFSSMERLFHSAREHGIRRSKIAKLC